LHGSDLVPVLGVDAESRPEWLTLERVEELGRLGPTGQGNPPVRLMVTGVRLSGSVRRMGKERQHARFSVVRDGITLPVVWWNCDELPSESMVLDLVAEAECDEYQGRRSLQLRLLDWRPRESGDNPPEILSGDRTASLAAHRAASSRP